MTPPPRKLRGALQGALAGGGDPASSPLYVFGPFLQLLVAAGVAGATMGASIWLAVLTVATVSLMYRLVMVWVTDGSGGSGLSEEEFGPWAVKINASITVIEYTLTILVSIAALVTFIADRFPQLQQQVLGIPLRTLAAMGFIALTGGLVNLGPRVAARVFGPATGAVLVLLWVLMIAAVVRFGFRLPVLDSRAFYGEFLGYTLSGYARILALITGIEIFANLVAAYEGPAPQRSRMAFRSLLIVMGTTSLAMLVLGPAILATADPLDPRVSVFTQTMDHLLPAPLAYAGTLIGVAVLISAAAASAQGLQNLAVGLRYRHYLPAQLARRNRHEVAGRPVWMEVAVCSACFLLFGTAEETYLALYAAGVFILLSLTGWAAVKRLASNGSARHSLASLLTLGGVIVGAVLASGVTVIIFAERYREGAWAYLLLVPVLYLMLGRYRRRLGEPSRIQDRLGLLVSASTLPQSLTEAIYAGAMFRRILVPLDGSAAAEYALPVAQHLAQAYGADLALLSVIEDDQAGMPVRTAERYLATVAAPLRAAGIAVDTRVLAGDPARRIGDAARPGHVDAVVMTFGAQHRWRHWVSGDVTSRVIYQTTPPLIVVRPTDAPASRRTQFSRLLVALDGSATAEQVLPYVRELGARFRSEVILISVPEGGDPDVVAVQLRHYLERIAGQLRTRVPAVRTVVAPGSPARTVLGAAKDEGADLIMLVSHGRGGAARQGEVRLGSVAEQIVEATPCPVFLVSALRADSADGASRTDAGTAADA